MPSPTSIKILTGKRNSLIGCSLKCEEGSRADSGGSRGNEDAASDASLKVMQKIIRSGPFNAWAGGEWRNICNHLILQSKVTHISL